VSIPVMCTDVKHLMVPPVPALSLIFHGETNMTVLLPTTTTRMT